MALNNRFKQILPLLSFFLIGNYTFCQQSRKIFIEPKYHYGRLIIHSEKVRPLRKGNIEIVEFNLVFPTTGKHKWAQLYRYPDLGIGYQVTSWKNPEMIGTSHTLNSYIRIPIVIIKPFKLYYHIGASPSYFTKTYAPETNPLNLSIGSHLNLYIHVGLGAQLRIYEKLLINAGYGINHYSIGNLIQPNVGLNVDAAYVSMQYAINNEPTSIITNEMTRKIRRHEMWTYIGPGFKEIEIDLDTNAWGTVGPDPGHKYFTTTVSVNYAYQFNYKHKLGVGFEYFYDRSLKKRLLVQGVEDIKDSYLFRPGFNISHELLFSDLSFITQFGRYIYSKSTRFGNKYYRVALKYHFHENWFVILALKAHLPAIADFTEWGIGYRIRN